MRATETVLTDQLALEIARLGMVGESSDVGTLHRVTELASRAVPGCAGAASVRWALPGAPETGPSAAGDLPFDAAGLPPDAVGLAPIDRALIELAPGAADLAPDAAVPPPGLPGPGTGSGPGAAVPHVPPPAPDAESTRSARVEPLAAAASHPDLAEVTDRQLARGRGPVFDAALGRRTVNSDDILAETRWPEAMADMLRRGVRCFTTTAHLNPPVLVTLTLYGVTPNALGPGRHALAALLMAQGSAAVTNTRQYEDAHRTAAQLQEAVHARAVVDQAKGILMHALGCDADEAFAEMRRISQTRHVKLTALAQRIVGDQGLS
ncbi:ANTAR domain-containing response regulator [Actinomadura terrae]|uniref:ANTAR domain-containing response regulator n=1 Tax=Actinomadura terrae TaxID=604353 RepID=UPI001FA75202|nr:ANTAR domain-containing protein [Actinomadura terrae]